MLMSYRVTPHPVSGKSPTMLLFNREIRMKVPHVDSNSQTDHDDELRSRCHNYHMISRAHERLSRQEK